MGTIGELEAPPWHVAADPLLALHGDLRLRYQELRGRRDCGQGVVRLIEHGLEREEIENLLEAVRAALELHDPADPFWSRRFLPLCVVATEVGYDYRGTGTDYWPKLSGVLGFEFADPERQALRGYFHLAERLTGVAPPPTPWAEHYCLIAWPISHALFPMELHAKLLQALVRHPVAIQTGSSTDEILDPIRSWAKRAEHSQLLAFLALGDPAAAVVRHFLTLGDPTGSVDPAFLRRVSDELKGNTGALRDLRDARRRQRIFHGRVTRTHPEGAPTRAALPPVWAPLTLEPTMDGREGVTLLASLPAVPATVAAPLLDGLGPRARARLLGGARVGLAELIAGHPIELRLRSVPEPVEDGGAPLTTALPPDLPQQLALHLQRARVDVARPLLFAEHVGPASGAGQVRVRACYPGATWWLLGATARPGNLPPGVSPRGEVAGLRVYRVEPTCDEDFAWLQARGIAREHRAVVRLAGSPSWDGPRGDAPTLAPDDLLLLLVSQGEVRAADEADRLPPGAYVVTLGDSLGRRSLRLIDQGDQQEAVPVDVIAAPEPVEILSLSLEAPDLTVEALRRRQVGLRIQGSLPFAGLGVRLLLESEGLALARVDVPPMGPLPHAIPASDPCWQAIQELAYLVEDAPLRLTAEVGAVGCWSWVFEPSEWGQPWVAPKQPGGGPAEAGVQHRFTPARPHWPVPGSPPSQGVVLTQPVREDDGTPLATTGTVRAPDRMALGDRAIPQKPRLLRRLCAGTTADSADAWTLIQAWIAWATAVGAGLLAEGERRAVARTIETWLVELLCGDRWAQAERAVPRLRPTTFGALLADAFERGGLGRDEVADGSLSEVGSPIDPVRLRAVWADLFQERRELLRELVEADEDDPGFDIVCADLNRAYLLAAGERADADIYLAPEELQPVIREVVGRWEAEVRLAPLLPLLRPRRLARSIAEAGFSGLNRAGLVATLGQRLREKRGAPLAWDGARIEALVALFTHPARFPLDDLGRNTVTAALVDQAAARAIRYATLRWAMTDATCGRGEVL